MDRLILFKTELDLIKDKSLRTLAEHLINAADNYFFFIPASTSGKYHPPFDKGLCGLLRHTKVVAFVAHTLGVANMLDSNSVDILIVSAIAHDIKKIGTGSNGHTRKEHPQMAAEFVKVVYNQDSCNVPEDILETICKCISSHSGQWGEPVPKTNLEFLLHSADYIASRDEWLNFDFGDFLEPAPVEIGEVSIPFGKYVGKTIKEVLDEDSKYFHWMRTSDKFFNPTYQNLIKEYYKAIEPPVELEL